MSRARTEENEIQGQMAEEHVADQVGGERTPEVEWHDVIRPDGTKIEVKSTRVELDSGRPGRFRVWKDQHSRLSAANARGNAWYYFVLLSANGDILKLQRRRPATVTEAVDSIGSGEWNDAGHKTRGTRTKQKKIPHTMLVDR